MVKNYLIATNKNVMFGLFAAWDQENTEHVR